MSVIQACAVFVYVYKMIKILTWMYKCLFFYISPYEAFSFFVYGKGSENVQ